jgi:hypothetical protein
MLAFAPPVLFALVFLATYAMILGMRNNRTSYFEWGWLVIAIIGGVLAYIYYTPLPADFVRRWSVPPTTRLLGYYAGGIVAAVLLCGLPGSLGKLERWLQRGGKKQ